jgi:radical SAM superfamily enzyme YgiQ (UPF0313 family)
MKITLVQPAKFRDGTLASEHWNLSKPIALLYLASAIEKEGTHKWEIIDFEHIFLENPKSSLNEVLKNVSTDVFGITATTFTRFEAIKVARVIRELFPHTVIIVGGVHFMHCAEDTLSKIKEIDIVVRGEGEKILLNLLNALENKTSLARIKGITYRLSENEIVNNSDEIYFEDLDLLSIYGLMSPIDYPEKLIGCEEVNSVPAVSILTSRGCPYHCIFCSKSGMKYRFRSTENVINEIKYYFYNHHIHAFNFLDLTFTAHFERAKALCEKIIAEKLDIQWWCESRANIPLDLIPVMARAGCRFLAVGVESGSNRMLNYMQKNIDLAQVDLFIETCKDNGIQVTAYFMYSHLTETLRDALTTVEYIRSLLLKGISTAFQPCMILPGTEIERIAFNRNLLGENFSWNDEVEFDQNKNLGQLSNIPLFFDKLSYEDMLYLNKSYKDICLRVSLKARWSNLTFQKIYLKIKERGFWNMLVAVKRDFYLWLDELRVEYFTKIRQAKRKSP